MRLFYVRGAAVLSLEQSCHMYISYLHKLDEGQARS